MVGHQIFRPSLERLINIKHVLLSRELKERPVKTLQSAAQAVNVDHSCRRVRVRAETDRVYGIGKEVARPSDYFGDRVHAPFEANEHMVESFQNVQVISATEHIGTVQFVQPTYACPAPILPTLHGVHVKQISKHLDATKKQVVVLSEPDRAESGVDRCESSSHVPPQKPTVAFFPKPEAHAGFQWKEVNVIRLHENILSFIIRRLKRHASESSPSWRANPRCGRRPGWLRQASSPTLVVYRVHIFIASVRPSDDLAGKSIDPFRMSLTLILLLCVETRIGRAIAGNHTVAPFTVVAFSNLIFGTRRSA